MPSVAVIGSGFAGLASASLLAKEGFHVTVFEKNASPGGRARRFESDGFVFDMGPSWYWMPDVFDAFFQRLGRQTIDFYSLVRLDPSYRVFFGPGDHLDLPPGVEALCALFEKLERGSSAQLLRFLEEGKYKYHIGMRELVYKPGLSIKELIDPKLLGSAFRLHVFQSIASYIRKFFRDPRIIQLLEFPVLFLGATPQKIPALYSLMNYADMALGTWYPMGGMYKIVEGLMQVALDHGAAFRFNSAVEKLEISGTKARGLWSNGVFCPFDYVVAGADYHHVEQELLPEGVRKYDSRYWDSRVVAPSSLIFYLGVDKKLSSLLHHNLFFDQDFGRHAREIYDDPQWPSAPQFYVCCSSKTDPSVASPGHENLFILIPVAPGLTDTEAVRGTYYDLIMKRLESLTGQPIRANVIFKRSYAHNNFMDDYNAFKGNAYGLANTLWQTANLKPSIVNRKVANLFYTGQLTVPGPGVPPAIISGQVVARELIKRHRE